MLGQSYFNYKFSFGPFWNHKIKTKVKYISISNILHLLSTPDSVPCAEPVLACLVAESKAIHKFSVSSNFKFDCCLASLYIQSKKQGDLIICCCVTDEILLDQQVSGDSLST